MKVHLLSSNHDGAQENKWEVPFDPSLREVTVSLSGPSPQIELSDPFGTYLQHRPVARALYVCHREGQHLTWSIFRSDCW